MKLWLLHLERAALRLPAAVFWRAAARLAKLDTEIQIERYRRANTEAER